MGFGLITFDCDRITPELLAEITDPSSLHPITDFEFFLYSTRGHEPEAPRVRLVFPLPGMIDAEDYVALVRYLAQLLDPDMVAVDPVSFRPAQLMYRPSCAADQEFVAHRNRAFVIDPVEFLADKDRDWLALPRGAGEKTTHRAAEKAEDPWEKDNIIGDFCRAYTVQDAIAEFLPDCYAPGDYHADGNPRYTYLKGSAANGAVVYDDGRFLYSWHGTDPAGEQLVNAFDLVRLHKFSDQDEHDYRENPDPTTLKSYAAMTDFAAKQDAVRREGLERHVGVLDLFEVIDDEDDRRVITDGTAPEPDDGDSPDESSPRPDEDDAPPQVRPKRRKSPKGWRDKYLTTNQDNSIRKTVQNMQRILMYDKRTHDRLVWDEINQQPAIRFPAKIAAKSDDLTAVRIPNPKGRKFMSPLEPNDVMNLQTLLTHEVRTGGWNMEKIADRDFRHALGLACAANPVNAVRDFCDGLKGKWDGVELSRTMFARHLGEAEDAYTAAAGELLMLGLVTRAYEPGHKWDYMPIIEGAQGVGKSTYLRSLVGAEWCGDLTHGVKDTNKFVEQTRGKVVVELGELSAWKGEDIERIKDMLTVQSEKTRLAYGLAPQEYQRRVILLGTTNTGTYLFDPTGNRRFWPLKVSKAVQMMIDHVAVIAERRQLWAEAVHKYHALREQYPNRDHLPLYLTGEAEGIWQRWVKGVEVDDIRGERLAVIEHFLNTPVPLSEIDGPGFAKAGEQLVLRVKTCATEIMQRVLCAMQVTSRMSPER